MRAEFVGSIALCSAVRRAAWHANVSHRVTKIAAVGLGAKGVQVRPKGDDFGLVCTYARALVVNSLYTERRREGKLHRYILRRPGTGQGMDTWWS
jgi:hypothetical protein